MMISNDFDTMEVIFFHLIPFGSRLMINCRPSSKECFMFALPQCDSHHGKGHLDLPVSYEYWVISMG